MKYKAIIFDMDGLMVDTEIIEHRSFERLLREYGKEPKPYANGLIHQVGVAGSSYYEDFKQDYGLKDSLEIIRDKKRLFFEEILIKEELLPLPGLIDLLNLLKKEKYIIAIASNRNEKFINLIVEKLSIKEFFHLIVGPSENRKHKPAPDIYLHTAKELKLEPEECIVLEDSEPGIVSAKKAGMKVVAVPNIYIKKEHDFSKADIIVNSLSDINMDLLKSI